MNQRILSPCVGVCSTTVGDDFCRGCQRSLAEIRDWPGYSDAERRARLQALDELRAAVAGEFLHVEDAVLLEAQLRRHGVRFRDDQPPLSRAVELLRVGRTRIRDLERYGLQAHGKAMQLSADKLHEAIARRLMAQAASRRPTLESL